MHAHRHTKKIGTMTTALDHNKYASREREREREIERELY